MKPLTLILALLIATACSKGGGGSATQPAITPPSCGSKDLFSNWYSQALDADLYLQGQTFGTWNTNYFIQDATCNIDFRITGTQCSGTYEISNSTWNGDGTVGDPNCFQLDQTGTYEKTAEGLMVCLDNDGGCALYQ